MPLLPYAETTDDTGAPNVDGCRSEKLRDAFALLSQDDLGALLGVDPRTIAIWRSQRRGPDYVKLGKAVFYRRSDVIAWVELNVTPTDRAN